METCGRGWDATLAVLVWGSGDGTDHAKEKGKAQNRPPDEIVNQGRRPANVKPLWRGGGVWEGRRRDARAAFPRERRGSRNISKGPTPGGRGVTGNTKGRKTYPLKKKKTPDRNIEHGKGVKGDCRQGKAPKRDRRKKRKQNRSARTPQNKKKKRNKSMPGQKRQSIREGSYLIVEKIK